MKATLTVAALAAASVALSGCSTMIIPEADRAAVLKGAAEHIEKCDRDYWANTGLPGSAGFRITCRQPPPSMADQAAEIATAVQAAVTKAMDAYTAPR